MAQDLGYLGRLPQGTELSVVVQCHDGSLLPAWPDAAPVLTVYSASGTAVLTKTLPADLQGVQAGTFRLPLFLGRDVGTAGRYLVAVRYTDADADPRVAVGHFTLLAGGSADGAVVALRPVVRPSAVFVIRQTDGGRLTRGLNPR